MVHEQMGDGKVFIGKQALKAGLIDHIGNFDDALALARARGGAMPNNMTKATLQAENLELFQAILAEGAASVTVEAALAKQPEAAEKFRNEGIQAERARVTEILEYEGDAAVTLEAIKTGKSFGEMVKLSRQAEKEGRTAALAAMQAGAPPPLGQTSPPAGGQDYQAKVQELIAAGKSRGQAVKQVAREFPALHAAYLAQQNPAKK